MPAAQAWQVGASAVPWRPGLLPPRRRLPDQPILAPDNEHMGTTRRHGSWVLPNTVMNKPHSPGVTCVLTEMRSRQTQVCFLLRRTSWCFCSPDSSARAYPALTFLLELQVCRVLLTLIILASHVCKLYHPPSKINLSYPPSQSLDLFCKKIKIPLEPWYNLRSRA